MGLEVEHRASESPYVTRVWRATGEETVDEMLAVAYACWDLVFWDVDGTMHVSVVGPSARAYPAPVPDATVSFGINFGVGVVLPQLPASRVVEGITHLPDVTRRRFHLAGSTWDVPSYDNAEAFVAALVREACSSTIGWSPTCTAAPRPNCRRAPRSVASSRPPG